MNVDEEMLRQEKMVQEAAMAKKKKTPLITKPEKSQQFDSASYYMAHPNQMPQSPTLRP